MPLPKFLAQLQHLPKNQQVALGVGAVGATGAGLYSYRKRKTSGGAGAPKSSTPPFGQLAPPDLSQYGQVAVLVPIDHQDGANFGGSGGLTGPLSPGTTTPTTPATPSTTQQNVLTKIKEKSKSSIPAYTAAQAALDRTAYNAGGWRLSTAQEHADALAAQQGVQIAGRAGALAKYPAGGPTADNRVIPPGFGPPLSAGGPFTIKIVGR